MRWRQLGGVLDADDPLVGRHRVQHRRQQRGLARAGAPGHQERQPGRDDAVDQLHGRGCDGAGCDQRGQILGGRPQHPQRQAGAASGDRRQHGVQPDRELARAQPGQLTVDPRLRVVESPTGAKRQPLRQSSHGGFVGELNISAPQPVSVVDPHRVRRTDQHVGRPVRAQQRLENSRAGQLGLQYPKIAQQFGVAEHPAGFGPDRVGHHLGSQRRGFRRPAAPAPGRSANPSCRACLGVGPTGCR